jgi:dolichol-phosphate mannosyltransferase
MNSRNDISPKDHAEWQVPAMEVQFWLGKRRPYCVVIPVINEGDRIKRLLKRMASHKISSVGDIIIVDGGSTDGSLELGGLQQAGARGLLVKTSSGGLSAQLRCGYAFALDHGYEGVVTIDGNDKDDPEAIPRFIDALTNGIDFVQASRFIPGGIAENTPKSRDFAIRYIHAPALSISSGFRWTDTTQGFRAYSRKMLLDPCIAPFREIFQDYELLAYLSHQAPRLGYKCIEISTARRYPKGEVPTKISSFKGNLKILKTMLFACLGVYNLKERARPKVAPVTPIYWIIIFGLIVSILAFFPGWMSNDSIIQYREARAGQFNDWHPVIMAWWWRQLDRIYQGPALFLIQNLLLYWGGWGLLANAVRRESGRYSYLVPLLGLWPALFFPLGQIWKDVAFATSQFLAWAIIINVFFWHRTPSWIERIILFLLISFSIGVKTNGIVVVPFIATFWLYVEKIKYGARFAVFLVLITTLSAAVPYWIGRTLTVKHDSPLQYTQVYDLLAISVKSSQNLLPSYIEQRTQLSLAELKKIYVVGHNNDLFYGTTKDLVGLRAPRPEDILDLRKAWLKAIKEFPLAYLSHRWENFLSLMRIGHPWAAYVASPIVVDNEFGIIFTPNSISSWLNKTPTEHPWIFFPWVYVLLMLASMTALFIERRINSIFLSITGASLAFVAPHFFIAPASDFRYLYYSYFCSIIIFVFAFFRRSADSRAPH